MEEEAQIEMSMCGRLLVNMNVFPNLRVVRGGTKMLLWLFDVILVIIRDPPKYLIFEGVGARLDSYLDHLVCGTLADI